MLTSENITKIMPAFLAAQSNFAPAIKGKDNPFFKSKYVPLDAVIDAVAPALRDQGICILQQTDIEDARTVLITKLIHASGEWIAGRYPVHPIKADPQGEGSALTYARRYALMALVGIAPEDDDGNAAAKAAQKPTVSTINASPHDGVWEVLDAVTQVEIHKIGVIGNEYAEAGDIPGLYEYIQKQGLSSEEKIALNTMFDPPTRSALKREHAAHNKGAKAA